MCSPWLKWFTKFPLSLRSFGVLRHPHTVRLIFACSMSSESSQLVLNIRIQENKATTKGKSVADQASQVNGSLVLSSRSWEESKMMILKLMQTFASWQHKDNHKQTGNHIQNAISLKPNFKSRNIDRRLFDFHHILSPKVSLHNNKKLELLNVLQTQIGRHLGSKTLVTRF